MLYASYLSRCSANPPLKAAVRRGRFQSAAVLECSCSARRAQLCVENAGGRFQCGGSAPSATSRYTSSVSSGTRLQFSLVGAQAGLINSRSSRLAMLVAIPMGARYYRVKARNRGNVYVSRREARMTLEKATRRQSDARLLLPPYVSAAELRVIFRLDYAGICRLLGVQRLGSRYYWKDHLGRQFETSTKRKVVVPFEIAAIPAQGVGFNPKMCDVEPDWDVEAASKKILNPVPVVAVLGHINHGKTTLLDALCGTNVAADEPGGITQEVRAMTGDLSQGCAGQAMVTLGSSLNSVDIDTLQTPVSPQTNENQGLARFNASRMTFLDTPGHEAFELLRGRIMACADAALVVVSAERGAEVQTEEVLIHASRWKVPVVFALNKIDLEDAHVDLTRAELRRQCQRLHEEGYVDVDWTREAEAAVPISALHGWHLGDLLARVHETLRAVPRIPQRPPEPPTRTPGAPHRFKDVIRRTDFLVGLETPPSAVALVVEYERGAEQGDHVLTLLVRIGRLAVGQYFVVGTLFGRITSFSIAHGDNRNRWMPNGDAGVGTAVKIRGLRMKFGGDCSPDDLLFALPTERAWRLSEHRRRLENLMTLQSAGPPIDVPWEHDAYGLGARTQNNIERTRHQHPEKHAASAYQRALAQPAVQEFGSSTAAVPQMFSDAPRQKWEAPMDKGTRALGLMDQEGDSAVAREATPTGGRKSKRKAVVGEPIVDMDRRNPGRFAVIRPADSGGSSEPRQRMAAHSTAASVTHEENADAHRTGGRKSKRNASEEKNTRTATGAWTASTTGPGTEEDFVYYMDRESWTEEAAIDSARLRARWQERDVARWEELERQARLVQKEKRLAEEIRRKVFGEPPLEEDEVLRGPRDDKDQQEEEEEEEVTPLPPENMPIVSMILKAKSVSQFDVLMDEVERLQAKHKCRVVIVHGGLGPVIPTDVVHAEIEKQYGFCPIYAFQVGVHPVAASHADKEAISIRRFDVFTELVADVAARCERIHWKKGQNQYAESLKTKPTRSGW